MPIIPPTGGQDPNDLMNQQPVSLPVEGQLAELSTEPGASVMSQEEMKAEIDRMLTKVNDKEQSVKTKMSVDKFKFDAMKANLIRSLFDILKKAGVNPGDPTSIKDFLSQLQQRDPDLYSIFEIAFNDLMDFGAGQQGQLGQQAPPQGGMPMQPMTMPAGAQLQGGGGMPNISPVTAMKQRPGKKQTGLLKKFSNLSNKTFRGK